MAISLVRKPSETPNINNFDDYRMFRYATGGYNGVVEKYGNECDYEISGSDFKIKSGEIVIDGVQARIDTNGKTITVDSIVGTQYYSIYCEINLSLVDNQKVEIKSSYDTATYPIIDNGDDLTENQIGIARLELYRFVTTNGVISGVVQRFNFVEIGQAKNSENAINATNATNAVNAENAFKATNDSDGNKIIDTYNEKLFDVVIRTQEKFETLIASPTWLGARNVAFVGNGGSLVFTLSTANNSGIKIPNTVEKIVGFNTAKITVTNFNYNSETAKGGLWHTQQFDGVSVTNINHSITNLTVECIGVSGSSNAYAFGSCANLRGCAGIAISTGTGYQGSAGAFHGCMKVINCIGYGTGSSSNYGGFGFYGCGEIINCYGKGTGTGSGNGYGFYSCSNIINCTGSGFANGTGSGYGYYNCSYGSNNMDLNSKTAKTGGTMTKWSSETND